MRCVGLKDQTDAEPLAPLKIIMLDNVIRVFLQGLSNVDVQKDATKIFTMTNTFLRNVYNLAEEARRAKIEPGKLFFEQMRANEISFYKDLAERNLTRHQLETLLTSDNTKSLYHNKQQLFQWAVYADPSQFFHPPQPFYFPQSLIPSNISNDNKTSVERPSQAMKLLLGSHTPINFQTLKTEVNIFLAILNSLFITLMILLPRTTKN